MTALRRKPRRGAAGRLGDLVAGFIGGELPLRLLAWDGSEAGPTPDSTTPTVVIRSRRALRRLLWNPGELGLAQAYVTGELDVEGDLAAGLSQLLAVARERGLIMPRPDRAGVARGCRYAGQAGCDRPTARRAGHSGAHQRQAPQ